MCRWKENYRSGDSNDNTDKSMILSSTTLLSYKAIPLSVIICYSEEFDFQKFFSDPEK